MKARRYLLLIASLTAVGTARSQDPQFSQFYAASQYLNPALTGNTFQDRIALNYRLQWPGVQPGYETYAFAYDHNFASAHSGLGGMVMRDKAGTYGLTFTTVAMSYSYEARINRRQAIRFGFRAGYTMRNVAPDGYLFADQIIRDNAATSVEANLVPGISYLDLATGGLYYSEQFWAGASFNHINKPNQSLMLDGEATLPIRTTVHVGYRFPLDGQKLIRSGTKMTLASHYKAQGKWDQLDLGGYIEHSRISGGLWYRGLPIFKAYKKGYSNSEAVILMVGFETEKQLRLTYSYDITISKLTMKSAGAHEISMIYEWPRRAKARKHKVVPCPKF
ncbi:MAG TPA: type IX secretion system membrane protein PorP/SprF [Flavobacteriales bacterium]|nr:type IX secretion system membrane protein PorP/SprF [Flavobacteriales bacterium]